MMKKKTLYFGVIALLLGIGIAGSFWGASIAVAASSIWNSCNRGQVNCEYPGECHDYRDTNKDSICDRSQSAPVQITAVQTGTAAVTASTPASSQAVNSTGIEIPSVQTVEAGSSVNTVTDNGSVEENGSASSSGRSYYFVPIFLVLAVLYAVTWIFSLKGKITRVLQRRIWNLVLLFSTVVSALLGLFLILRIDFNINISLPFNMLFWHVEAGIALGAVAVFHILWHWRYFAKIFTTGQMVEKPVQKLGLPPDQACDPALNQVDKR